MFFVNGKWTCGARVSMGFGITVFWRELMNHVGNCYIWSYNQFSFVFCKDIPVVLMKLGVAE